MESFEVVEEGARRWRRWRREIDEGQNGDTDGF